jgi:hypothetical protein
MIFYQWTCMKCPAGAQYPNQKLQEAINNINKLINLYSSIILPATALHKVSYETSFDSKQPQMQPKLVSTLSETRCLSRLFCLNIKPALFGVSIEPKQTKIEPKQPEKN